MLGRALAARLPSVARAAPAMRSSSSSSSSSSGRSIGQHARLAAPTTAPKTTRALSSTTGANVPPPPGDVVKKGDRVEVDLVLRDRTMKENGGLLVDTKTDDSSPVSFVVGQGQVLVGLENRVIGMAVGESWKATFGPDEAFGHVTPDRVVKVPLRKDDEGQIVEAVPQIGHVVHLSNGAVGTVVDTTEDYVEIDTNHKMAGKDIEVELTLLEIKDELEEAWSGIRVETVAEGDNLNYPNNGDMVHVHYTLQLASNGKVVDSSTASGRPLSFQIGMGRVIAGWDQGILRLSLGERARLYVASEFGYGSQGAGGGLIPPNENLVFDVELVGINELRPPSSKL